MNYINTTQLRTKTSQLITEMKKGNKVSLVHRSQIVGEFIPASAARTKVILDAKKFEDAMRKLKPKKLIPKKNRDKIYRQHLEQKYGKGLS